MSEFWWPSVLVRVHQPTVHVRVLMTFSSCESPPAYSTCQSSGDLQPLWESTSLQYMSELWWPSVRVRVHQPTVHVRVLVTFSPCERASPPPRTKMAHHGSLVLTVSQSSNALARLARPTRIQYTGCVSLRIRGHSHQLSEHSTDIHKKSFLIRCLYSFVK